MSAVAADSHDSILETKSAAFRNDLPTISDAMKSFLAVQMAEDITKPPEVLHMRGGKALNFVGGGGASNTVTNPYIALSHSDLLKCAQMVLRAINAYEPETEADWSGAHPQGEKQGGLDRLDAVAEFRVARVLAAHVRKQGGKTTKLFGRRFLHATGCWPGKLRALAEADLAAAGLNATGSGAFLDAWGRAVADAPRSPVPAAGRHGDDGSLAALVWATDLSGALQRRRLARAAEAKARVTRDTANRSALDELKAVVAAGEELTYELDDAAGASGTSGTSGAAQQHETPAALRNFSFAAAPAATPTGLLTGMTGSASASVTVTAEAGALPGGAGSADGAPAELPQGATVVLAGLSATRYNGQRGVVVTALSGEGRQGVRLAGDAKESILVKVANMALAPADE